MEIWMLKKKKYFKTIYKKIKITNFLFYQKLLNYSYILNLLIGKNLLYKLYYKYLFFKQLNNFNKNLYLKIY